MLDAFKSTNDCVSGRTAIPGAPACLKSVESHCIHTRSRQGTFKPVSPGMQRGQPLQSCLRTYTGIMNVYIKLTTSRMESVEGQIV